MNLRKSIGPALAFLLLIGVGFGIRYSMRDRTETEAAARRLADRIEVRILAGSEKGNFLADAELAKVLDSQGITISVQKAGSREMAGRRDLKTFDVAYPAGAQAAVKIAQVTGSKRTFASFYSPMAVATWKTLIPALEKAGLVSQTHGSYYTLDMGKLVETMRKGTRWKELPGNTAYAASKSVLIASTDPRKSNSGGMYLSLASYLANGNNVVDNEADADKVADSIVGLFSRQGFQQPASEALFEDYTSMGIGKVPLAMIYEQQFLEYALSNRDPNSDMALLYPVPTILSTHTLVAISDNGARFAQAMTTNPKIDSIAQRYGFRTQDSAELFAAVQTRQLVIPRTIVDVIDPPSYDILETLIGRIDAALTK